MTDQVVYTTKLLFNSVYVIESLPPGDSKTGEDLYDVVVFPKSRALEGLQTDFSRVANEAELTRKLLAIAHAAKVANHHPIIHLETHGTESGIALGDGSFVSWRNLAPLFARINEACRMNLLVVALACQGWNLTYSLMPSDRAPVFMLVGPPDDMTAAALLSASSGFYESLFAELDVNKGLVAMNKQLDFKDWPVRPATAEILFCRVFRLYLKELGSNSALQERENELVARFARQKSLDVMQTAELRLALRADLSEHRQAYNRLRETFLMLDLFPDNRARFGLTYDKCMPAPPS
jgi:hypothetical protein